MLNQYKSIRENDAILRSIHVQCQVILVSFRLDFAVIMNFFSYWMKNFLVTKSDNSDTQSTDILETPSTLGRRKKVNHPSYSNHCINSQALKNSFTAITCMLIGPH